MRSPAIARTTLAALCLCAGLAAAAPACPPVDQPAVVDGRAVERPVVRIAILLDTSNSMDGLIAQAKSQVWSIVNRFGRSCRAGARPDLRIALYEYGNNSIKPSEGYIRQVLPFTTDLDLLSEKLFGLTTNGGEEFCGAVIKRAIADLDWAKRPGDLSMVVIAGNEPFTQGDVHYSEAIADALTKGVKINTIFCGNRQEGVATKWVDGAVLGRGTFGNIDQNAPLDTCATPYDDEIVRLGSEINITYIPYGRDGETGQARQTAMDEKNMAVPGAAPERAASKASGGGQYRNGNWDLVDAVKEGRIQLKDMDERDLPADMQKMNATDREKHLKDMLARRDEISRRIAELNKQRMTFIEQDKAKKAGEVRATGRQAEQTLGDALLAAIDKQATDEGYEFEK
ncbi:MAG: vWA domain-containing protein [Phycisphaerales bacterium]